MSDQQMARHETEVARVGTIVSVVAQRKETVAGNRYRTEGVSRSPASKQLNAPLMCPADVPR